jgi:threonine aldolase
MLNGAFDFRSDTITEPTEEMREAMARARVGDDGREGDPSVRELEEYSAALLGKEAALFVISGTMGNLVSVLAHTRHGQEVIVERDAHIYWTEVAGLSAVAGLLVNRVSGTEGVLAAAEVEAAIRPEKLHFPETGLICVENSHNMAGGTVATVEAMAALRAVAARHRVPVHLDGARLFNAAVTLKVPARDIAAQADSLTFCLSKGLSAPVGSVILGSKPFIEVCRKKRQMLGGTTRQGGVIAAAGLVALRTMVGRLAEDHANARRLADRLRAVPGLRVGTPQTNIVQTDTGGLGVPASRVAALLAEQKVLVLPQRPEVLRWLTHRHIGPEDVEEAAAAMRKVAEILVARGGAS